MIRGYQAGRALFPAAALPGTDCHCRAFSAKPFQRDLCEAYGLPPQNALIPPFREFPARVPLSRRPTVPAGRTGFFAAPSGGRRLPSAGPFNRRTAPLRHRSPSRRRILFYHNPIAFFKAGAFSAICFRAKRNCRRPTFKGKGAGLPAQGKYRPVHSCWLLFPFPGCLPPFCTPAAFQKIKNTTMAVESHGGILPIRVPLTSRTRLCA